MEYKMEWEEIRRLSEQRLREEQRRKYLVKQVKNSLITLAVFGGFVGTAFIAEHQFGFGARPKIECSFDGKQGRIVEIYNPQGKGSKFKCLPPEAVKEAPLQKPPQ